MTFLPIQIFQKKNEGNNPVDEIPNPLTSDNTDTSPLKEGQDDHTAAKITESYTDIDENVAVKVEGGSSLLKTTSIIMPKSKSMRRQKIIPAIIILMKFWLAIGKQLIGNAFHQTSETWHYLMLPFIV